MSRKNKHSELFNSNGCLSQHAIEKHISGQLSDEELHAVREHVSSCELCADALEGASLMMSAGGYSKRIDQMHRTDWRRSQRSGGKSRRLYYGLSSVAASLILLFGLFFIFRMQKIFNDGADKLNAPRVADAPVLREDSLSDRDVAVFQQPQSEAYKVHSEPQSKMVTSKKKNVQSAEEGLQEKPLSTTPAEEQKLEVIDEYEDISEEELEIDEDLQLFEEMEALEEVATIQSSQAYSMSRAASPSVSNESRTKSAMRTSSAPVQMQYLQESEEDVADNAQSAGSKSYVVAEVTPMFRGGSLNEFNTYLQDTLVRVLPDSLWQKSIVVSFVVDVDGALKKVKLLSGTGIRALDKQVVQLVKESSQWTPAMQAGKAVESEQQMRVVLDTVKNRGN